MESYQKLLVIVSVVLLIGAALSETFLHVTWSSQLFYVVALPIGGLFANGVFSKINSKAAKDMEEKLKKPKEPDAPKKPETPDAPASETPEEPAVESKAEEGDV